MRISRLLIDGFGLFDGRFELELPGGIALIVGDNETGKSTLVAAIGAILFGLGSEKERDRFAPYDSAGPRSGSLEIETSGDRYRFTREFASNHTKVEQLGETARVLFDGSAKPGGRTNEKEAYDRLMGTLLGLESRELFYNSVFVEQNSLPAEIESVVSRIVSGSASADYTVALKNLTDACDELTMEVPWAKATRRKPRRIERLHSELQEKRRALSDLREAGDVIEKSRTRLAAVESQSLEITQSLADRRAWEKELASFSTALAEKNRLEGQLNECRGEMREIEKLMQELKECDERIQKELSEYSSLPPEAEAELANLRQLRESVNEMEERYRQAEQVIPRFRLSPLAVVAIVIGLSLAAVGALFLDGVMKVTVILAGFGVAAMSVGSAFLALRSRKSTREGKLGEIRNQLDSLKRRTAEIEGRYPALSRSNLDDVFEGFRKFKHLHNEMGKKEEALKHRPNIETIKSKYDSLANDLLLANKKLEDLRAQRPTLRDVEQRGEVGKAVEDARAKIQSFEKQLQELNDEKSDLRLKVATAEARETVSEETLEEEIAEADAELDKLKLSRDAYVMAVKVLEEAITDFGSSHLARIEERTSDYLTRITGAECRVRLNKELVPLAVERAGQHFTTEQLSTGVSDQLHFALRLAAIEEVCGDIRLPILLDDPFVNFDESRLRATLRALEALSESHQIVLLTHDRSYCDWHEPARLLEK